MLATNGDEAEFQAWRQKVWRRRCAAVGALMAMAVGVAGWLIVRVTGRAEGELPGVEEVERELEVWALTEREAILRGRPLREVGFTSDANREEPLFSVYLNREGDVVAFSGEYDTWPEEALFSERAGAWAQEHLSDWDFARSRAVERFLARYLGGLRRGLIPMKVAEESEWRVVRRGVTEHEGFEVELTEIERPVRKGGVPLAKRELVIVRSKSW